MNFHTHRYPISDRLFNATLDKNGKVTGVAAGNCMVYANTRNSLAKKCKVPVK